MKQISREGSFRKTARLITSTLLPILLAAPLVSAQELVAIIEEVEGTVEIQVDGGSWEAVVVGDIVPVDARISTGFGARAVVAVGENASITVGSLTRLGIDELVEEEGVERSELNLEVGRIQGDVREADLDRTEFDLRSPVATASVRGTSFDFNGRELSVSTGVVEFESATLGRTVTIRPQEFSSSDGIDVVDGSTGRASQGEVRHETEGGDDEADGDDRRVTEDPATVTVIFGGFR